MIRVERNRCAIGDLGWRSQETEAGGIWYSTRGLIYRFEPKDRPLESHVSHVTSGTGGTDQSCRTDQGLQL